MSGGLTVLFLGATGRFGALTSLLIARGHRVLATTRDPGTRAARLLTASGAEVVRADFDDATSLAAAVEQADAVVFAGTAHAAGPAGDVRHGRHVVDAAKSAGTTHLIYVTVAGADRRTGVPIMDSKYEVERHLRSVGVPHTVLAPGYFMENVWNPWNAAILAAGRLPSPVPPDRMLQQISIDDVLAVVARSIEVGPVDERVELAADELTPATAAAAVSALLGRPIRADETPPANPLFAWLDRVGTGVDISAVRERFPDVPWHTFSDWAAGQDWPA